MEDHDMLIVMGLKDPWKFLFVDMDIAMVSASVGFALLSTGLPTPVVVGTAAAVGYFMHIGRKGKPRGYAAHLAYWYLPPLISRLKRVPAPWATRTVG
ncbi:Type IV conjugative transfer system protein TraL [Rubrivivax sp. A210]|uniref:type IV conjugative transfer system protein TraL n=1 Tax=Rubrivivax sp. A210 TaxID=2772301 RepID=UPI00191B0DA4|nr:type IV conjugative transfer system protein TraL [Rubrivivax sp. A210]CAD5366879.1 Type IV conjugative transfer system protein TraL [Rubrivivax sp. A210]